MNKTLFVAFILAGCLRCSLPQEEAHKIDLSKMEAVEELTEALANQLLELSVAARQKDQAAIAFWRGRKGRTRAGNGARGVYRSISAELL